MLFDKFEKVDNEINETEFVKKSRELLEIATDEDDDLKLIFHLADVGRTFGTGKNDNKLNKTEFRRLARCIPRDVKDKKEQLAMIFFGLIDRNGNNKLNKEEIREMMKVMGITNESEIDLFYQKVTKGQSGGIMFDDFKNWFLSSV